MSEGKGARIDPQRAVDTFIELAGVDAPSGREQPMFDVMAERLEGLGFTVEADEAHRATGGECGNLFAWHGGTAGAADVAPVFLSGHLDTVSSTAGLRTRIVDGYIETDGTTILGADDRAALAGYLTAITAIREQRLPMPPLQVVLTVNEQVALLGARNLDFGRMRATRGFIYDNHVPVGDLVVAGPAGINFELTFHGQAAHITNVPASRSALLGAAEAALAMMEPGGSVGSGTAAAAGSPSGEHRSAKKNADQPGPDQQPGERAAHADESPATDTVANLGLISGGEITSKVPDRVSLRGEVRSLTAEGAAARVDELIAAARSVTESRGLTVAVDLEHKYEAWHLDEDHAGLALAKEAGRRLGLPSRTHRTLGGADTNIFRANGFDCFTLGVGFENIHSFQERVPVDSVVVLARHVAEVLHLAAEGA